MLSGVLVPEVTSAGHSVSWATPRPSLSHIVRHPCHPACGGRVTHAASAPNQTIPLGLTSFSLMPGAHSGWPKATKPWLFLPEAKPGTSKGGWELEASRGPCGVWTQPASSGGCLSCPSGACGQGSPQGRRPSQKPQTQRGPRCSSTNAQEALSPPPLERPWASGKGLGGEMPCTGRVGKNRVQGLACCHVPGGKCRGAGRGEQVEQGLDTSMVQNISHVRRCTQPTPSLRIGPR